MCCDESWVRGVVVETLTLAGEHSAKTVQQNERESQTLVIGQRYNAAYSVYRFTLVASTRHRSWKHRCKAYRAIMYERCVTLCRLA